MAYRIEVNDALARWDILDDGLVFDHAPSQIEAIRLMEEQADTNDQIAARLQIQVDALEDEIDTVRTQAQELRAQAQTERGL